MCECETCIFFYRQLFLSYRKTNIERRHIEIDIICIHPIMQFQFIPRLFLHTEPHTHNNQHTLKLIYNIELD